MSSKRALKKQQKREASALAQLQDLYRRGADGEFLARAAEHASDLSSSPLAAQWAEAADRACRQSLARFDLAGLERVLRSIRRGGPPRPLAILAESVLDLAAGRLESARSRLAGLADAESAAAAVPPGLVAELQALAGVSVGPGGGLPDSRLQGAGKLYQALQGLEARAFDATAADRKALARSVKELRATAPAADGEVRRLLDGAERCLSLLGDLAALDAKLARLPESGSQASAAVAGWLRGSGPLLATALAATGPFLVAPLQHAVRTAWRAVLERVASREGSPGLAALLTADPKLLAHDVDLPGSPAQLRQHAQARQLLAAESYAELADLLRSTSRTASDSGEVATLWSLELWAFQRQTQQEFADEEDEDPFPRFAEPTPHRALVRLQEMAGEIGRRFPAEQRAEVARFLAGKLFDLCEAVELCDHVAGAAVFLLEHQSGDVSAVGLLIAGVAGAIAGGSPRARRTLEAHLARQGQVAAGERLALARRLMGEVAHEEPSTIVQALAVLKPLFTGDAWSEIAALVAREMGKRFIQYLDDASEADPLEGRPDLGPARRELDRLRPALAGTPGFAGMELAVDIWRQDGAGVAKRVAKLLAASSDLEGALVPFEILENALSPWSPRGLQVALQSLGHAVIDRLDDRWQLWWRDVPVLALTADPRDVRSLEQKIRKLLASPEVQAQSRGALDEALHAIQHIEKMKRDLGRAPRRRRWTGRTRREVDLESPFPEEPTAQPRRKRSRRRRSTPPQLRLEFE